MKRIDTYILEKLHINKDIKTYKYYPTDKQELIECIIQKVKNEGFGDKSNPLDLNDIYTSDITDMSYLFSPIAYDKSEIPDLAEKIYPNVSKWDVSNVVNMYSMFFQSNFNGDLSKWNTSKVVNMSYMFNRSKFTGENGDITNWNVSKVDYMDYMFYGSKYDGNLEKWKLKDDCSVNNMFESSPLQSHTPKWYKTKH